MLFLQFSRCSWSCWGALPVEPRTLLLLRVSARLFLQPNPGTGWPGSSSVTEMHSEEEGVRGREEQTLLTLSALNPSQPGVHCSPPENYFCVSSLMALPRCVWSPCPGTAEASHNFRGTEFLLCCFMGPTGADLKLGRQKSCKGDNALHF